MIVIIIAVCWFCALVGFVLGCWWNAPNVKEEEYRQIIRKLMWRLMMMEDKGIEAINQKLNQEWKEGE